MKKQINEESLDMSRYVKTPSIDVHSPELHFDPNYTPKRNNPGINVPVPELPKTPDLNVPDPKIAGAAANFNYSKNWVIKAQKEMLAAGYSALGKADGVFGKKSYETVHQLLQENRVLKSRLEHARQPKVTSDIPMAQATVANPKPDTIIGNPLVAPKAETPLAEVKKMKKVNPVLNEAKDMQNMISRIDGIKW